MQLGIVAIHSKGTLNRFQVSLVSVRSDLYAAFDSAGKVDCTTSPTLARLLRKLRKKYRHIEDDLMLIIPDIEADYDNPSTWNAARPPKRKLGIEYWKYDFGSSDLKRSPRNSFRVVGIFLEAPEDGKERTMPNR